MSSFAGYCAMCEKPVMHKTFFGTLHLCLSPEEQILKQQYLNQQRLMQRVDPSTARTMKELKDVLYVLERLEETK